MQVTLNNIKSFYKSGRGRLTQCFITDEEMNDILLNDLPKDHGPYSLIATTFIEGKPGSFLHVKTDSGEFLDLRKTGFKRFFLSDAALIPELEVPNGTLDGTENGDFVQYYFYKGCINISHGWVVNGYNEETLLSMVDKFVLLDDPDQLFENKLSLKIYKILVKRINEILKFKSRDTLLDGRISTSKTKTISQGFADRVRSGLFKVKFEIIE